MISWLNRNKSIKRTHYQIPKEFTDQKTVAARVTIRRGQGNRNCDFINIAKYYSGNGIYDKPKKYKKNKATSFFFPLTTYCESTADRRITTEAVEQATETFKEAVEEEEITAVVEAIMATIHDQLRLIQIIIHSHRIRANHFLNLTWFLILGVNSQLKWSVKGSWARMSQMIVSVQKYP